MDGGRCVLVAIAALVTFQAADVDGAVNTPYFTWAQNDRWVFIKLPVRTGESLVLERSDVNVLKRQRVVNVTISQSGQPRYQLDLDLHQGIYTSESSWSIARGSHVVLRLFKKQEGLQWLRLLEDVDSPLLPRLGTDWDLAGLSVPEQDEGEGDDDEIKETDKGKMHIVMKEDGEDIACEVCRTMVSALQLELTRRRDVSEELGETITVEAKAGRTKVPYATSTAIVEEMLDDVCHSDVFDNYVTVRGKDGVRRFVANTEPLAKAQSSKKEKLMPQAPKTLKRVCRETVGEHERPLAKLLFKKRANVERAVCFKLIHACDAPNTDWQDEYIRRFGSDAGKLYDDREAAPRTPAKPDRQPVANARAAAAAEQPAAKAKRTVEKVPMRKKKKEVPRHPPPSRAASIPTPTAPLDAEAARELEEQKRHVRELEAQTRRGSYEDEL